jgi:hypothetical protein
MEKRTIGKNSLMYYFRKNSNPREKGEKSNFFIIKV